MRDGTNVAVYERDGYKCVYCGVADDLVVDHVVPFKRGGTSDLDNLAAACRGCNSSKRTRTPSEWGQQ
jgi:5-methylcytosine-specific restriction endonuclease McrA